MKKTMTIAALMLAFITLSAQTDRFEQRYNLLVSKLGPAGVGVETLLDNWEQADSTNEKMLSARFNYYLAKARTSQVVKKDTRKYLGMSPLLSLKDTTGRDVYYYQEDFFDDDLYGQAIKVADRMIGMYQDKIDYRFMKANAYIAYEKESPDMALAYLVELAQEDAARTRPWVFSGTGQDKSFLEDAMQEYCYTFYTIGSPQAMKAFLTLSEKMNSLHPSNVNYLNNMGSYYLVTEKNPKKALKYYKKALKKNPDDETALKNIEVAKRMKTKKK